MNNTEQTDLYDRFLKDLQDAILESVDYNVSEDDWVTRGSLKIDTVKRCFAVISKYRAIPNEPIEIKQETV